MASSIRCWCCLVAGDVLPSYREELLREIALMKRIGKHPNIVSLIGACTIRDPIALIMEYMPFGNLQAFLQSVAAQKHFSIRKIQYIHI